MSKIEAVACDSCGEMHRVYHHEEVAYSEVYESGGSVRFDGIGCDWVCEYRVDKEDELALNRYDFCPRCK